jgi:hypothetical protein
MWPSGSAFRWGAWCPTSELVSDGRKTLDRRRSLDLDLVPDMSVLCPRLPSCCVGGGRDGLCRDRLQTCPEIRCHELLGCMK